MEAVELFEQKIKPMEVARRLRVSRTSAYLWHQPWRDGGARALASRGPSGSRCRLSPRRLVPPGRSPWNLHGLVHNHGQTMEMVTVKLGSLFGLSRCIRLPVMCGSA
ncbi:helix-turn-helix domain-containing protein [Streptomyces sp. NPDC050485]|uniref:helix-turn-helix domain-containing protein n=1 Tax=Streptomyces sp. NPDC050485 TaxID=3365617 RepID=UPI0037BA60C1